jgi:hypothetical protein
MASDRVVMAREEWDRIRDLEAENARLCEALIPFAFIGRASMEPLGLAEEYDEARRLLGLPVAGDENRNEEDDHG